MSRRPPRRGGGVCLIGRSQAPVTGGPESAPEHRYLLDNARTEAGERFTWLAELFDGVPRGHFDRLGVRAGWHC